MRNVRELVLDFETIRDPKAIPFIPEKGPRDRTDPAEKVAFDSNYIMICVAGFCDGERAWSFGLDYCNGNEAELLKAIWNAVGEYDRIITFNGLSFDVPLLYKRSWYASVPPTMMISLKKYDLNGSNHIDVRAVLGNWDQYARGNLDLYGALKLGERKTEGIDGAQVQGYWDAGRYDEVHKYCQQDTWLTWKLYQSLKGFYLPVGDPIPLAEEMMADLPL